MRQLLAAQPVDRGDVVAAHGYVASPAAPAHSALAILRGSRVPSRIMKKPEGSRYKALHRTLTLVADLLSGKQHDRRTAARRIGTQEAAAARQLKAIENVLPGIVPDDRDGLRALRLDLTAVTKPPTAGTAVAACFGSSLASLLDGSTYAAGLRDALEHVLKTVRTRKKFKDIERKFGFVPRGGEIALPDQAGHLDELVDAVLEEKIVRMQYQHFEGNTEDVSVAPLSIVICDHQFYVVGRTQGGALHPYRFSRIREVEATVEGFDYPPRAAYDPARVFADSIGVFIGDGLAAQDVELRLDQKWAAFALTHRWHRSQEVSVQDGGVRVRMRVRVCPELVAWILGFGETAEVIKPHALREKIAAVLARAHARYAEAARS